MSLRPPRTAVRAILIALGVALAGTIGYQRGAARHGAVSGAAAPQLAPSAAGPAGVGDPLGALDDAMVELDAARRERDIARATVAALREAMARADALAADERAELELYRRIGGEALPAGLSIDALERRRGEPPTLLVTLVQARGRGRASGRVLVSAGDDGSERPSEPLAEATFDLRFFETLELVLPSPPVGELDIEIVPDERRHDGVGRRVRWDELRILD